MNEIDEIIRFKEKIIDNTLKSITPEDITNINREMFELLNMLVELTYIYPGLLSEKVKYSKDVIERFTPVIQKYKLLRKLHE